MQCLSLMFPFSWHNDLMPNVTKFWRASDFAGPYADGVRGCDCKLYQNHAVFDQKLSLHPWFWPKNWDFLKICTPLLKSLHMGLLCPMQVRRRLPQNSCILCKILLDWCNFGILYLFWCMFLQYDDPFPLGLGDIGELLPDAFAAELPEPSASPGCMLGCAYG